MVFKFTAEEAASPGLSSSSAVGASQGCRRRGSIISISGRSVYSIGAKEAASCASAVHVCARKISMIGVGASKVEVAASSTAAVASFQVLGQRARRRECSKFAGKEAISSASALEAFGPFGAKGRCFDCGAVSGRSFSLRRGCSSIIGTSSRGRAGII